MKAVATTSALALYVALAAAQATLYIPGFDPQAITADVEGVAADGHTTWRIGPGVTSGTYEDPPGILHSATLIAGPTDAALVYDDPSIGVSLSEDCGINNGIAVCTLLASVTGSPLQSAVVTETASGFVVQGDGALPTGVTPGSSAGSGTDAQATQTSTNAAQTGTSTSTGTGADAAPTTTDKGNGAGRREASVMLALVGAGLVSAFIL